MIRSKIRILKRIRDTPRRFIGFLHPSLRPIALRQRKRWKVRRVESVRIRNRTVFYFPRPRVFPWHCETCSLSSRFFSVIEGHNCPKKNLSRHVQDFANEQRIALLGFRSKAKDAMAVMERVANPQAIDINTVHFPIIGDLSSCYTNNRIPRLSDLCADILVPKRSEYLVPTAEEFDRNITVKRSGLYNNKSQIGQLCNVCQRLFASYKEYDLHLEAEGCADDEVPDPLPVQISLLGTIPSEYGYGVRTSRPLTIRRRHICSACHRDDFHSTSAFHQHIIDCSRLLQLV